VSHYSDGLGEMPTQRLLDDASVEAVLAGRLVPSELEELASAVGVLRETARRPVRPSLELTQFMASGGLAASIREQQPTRWHTASSKLAGMSLRIKLAVGVAAGMTGLTGAAAAAGELPDAVQASVEVVETVVEKAAESVEVAAAGVEEAVEFVTQKEFPDGRVSSKGIEQPGKPDGPGEPTDAASSLPYAVDVEVPPAIASPTPIPSPTPTAPAVPPPVLEPPADPTPPPSPESTPTPEPEPSPTPTPTPEPTPSEEPPPPPPDPPSAGTQDDTQATTSIGSTSTPVTTDDPQPAPGGGVTTSGQ
jgi:hypothetical protein